MEAAPNSVVSHHFVSICQCLNLAIATDEGGRTLALSVYLGNEEVGVTEIMALQGGPVLARKCERG